MTHTRGPSTIYRWPVARRGSRDFLTMVSLVPRLLVPKTVCGFESEIPRVRGTQEVSRTNEGNMTQSTQN